MTEIMVIGLCICHLFFMRNLYRELRQEIKTNKEVPKGQTGSDGLLPPGVWTVDGMSPKEIQAKIGKIVEETNFEYGRMNGVTPPAEDWTAPPVESHPLYPGSQKGKVLDDHQNAELAGEFPVYRDVYMAINNKSEEQLRRESAFVRAGRMSIKDIEHPSGTLQDYVVSKNPNDVKYIKYPTVAVQQKILKHHPDLIEYVHFRLPKSTLVKLRKASFERKKAGDINLHDSLIETGLMDLDHMSVYFYNKRQKRMDNVV